LFELSEVVVGYALVTTTSFVDSSRRRTLVLFLFFFCMTKLFPREKSTESPKFHQISQRESLWKTIIHQLNTHESFVFKVEGKQFNNVEDIDRV